MQNRKAINGEGKICLSLDSQVKGNNENINIAMNGLLLLFLQHTQ